MPSFAEDLLKKAESYLDKGEFKVAEGIVDRFFNDVPEKDRTPALLMQAHLVAAKALAFRAEHVDALSHCSEAFALARKSGDVKAEAMTLRWLGYIHWRKGDFRKALEYASEGIERARIAKDRELEGVFRVDIGNCYVGLGQFKRGDTEYKVAVGILEGIPGTPELLRAYNNLGDDLKNSGEWVEAERYFSKVKSMAGDNIKWRGWGDFNRAECLIEMGRFDEARKDLDEAIVLLERSGDKMGRAAAFKYLGLLNAKKKDWFNAKRNLEFARDLMRELGMPVHEAKVVRELGKMYMWKGEFALARKNLEEARDLFRKHDSTVDADRTEMILRDVGK